MRIGLFAPLAGPFATGEYLETLGRGAEERGFHSLWVAEHVVLFDDYASSYPYSADGRIPAAPENGMLEPFTSLRFLAAVIQPFRLGTGICLLPQRNPVSTAKAVANVDFLASGRLDFGVGVGWLAEEFRSVSAPFERRGARCRSYLEVMRRLWCDETSEYKDDMYELPACRMYPKPIQKPHPPMWVTVTSPGTELDAADRGLGCLGVAASSFEEQERRTKEYHARIQVCDPVGAVNDQVSTLNFLYCHEDLKTGAARGMQMLGNFGLLNSHLLFTREAYPTRAYSSLANLAPSTTTRGPSTNPGAELGIPEGMCIGDPKVITQAIKRWESIGVDQVNFMLNATEVIAQPDVLESLRLFAREVMPAFAAGSR